MNFISDIDLSNLFLVSPFGDKVIGGFCLGLTIIIFLVWNLFFTTNKKIRVKKSSKNRVNKKKVNSIKKKTNKKEAKNMSKYADQIIDRFVKNYAQPINTPYVIGVCGGSGSGKSFIAGLIIETIKKMFPNSKPVTLPQDCYYLGGDKTTNFDEPSSIDFSLMNLHLEQLILGESIMCPQYDFVTHQRKKETVLISPEDIIIVDGTLIYNDSQLKNKMNMKIFINTDIPTQLSRRAMRDINERGRTIDGTFKQYTRDVYPSYKKYVKPSSKNADMIINNFKGCYVGPQIMLNHIICIIKDILKK